MTSAKLSLSSDVDPPQNPGTSGGYGGGAAFADFRPKLGLNEAKVSEEETGLDPIYFLKFPVLNEKVQGDEQFNDKSLAKKEGGGSKKDGTVAAAACS
nr:transcription factor FAMA [Ipomoea batatas]